MNPGPNTHPTVEEGVKSLVSDLKSNVNRRISNCESCVRRSPGKAVLASVAAGYLLHRLPVRSLVVAQVRLLVALAPPALFAFGAAKACEFLQNQARKSVEGP